MVLVALALAAPAGASTYLSATRSGGFAGTSTSLTVSGGGRVKTKSPDGASDTRRLSSKRFHALKRHVRAADFPHLKKSYGEQNCSDSFEYTLTRGSKTVTIIGCGAKLPRGLSVLLSDVNDLLG